MAVQSPEEAAAQSAEEEEEEEQHKQGYRAHLIQLVTRKRGLMLKAAKLALEFRAAEAEHRTEVFLFVTLLALMKDVPDLFSFGISTALTWAITVFILIFLWGRGTLVVRLILVMGSMFELIPLVNMLPMETTCVLYAWIESIKQAYMDRSRAEEHEKFTQNLDKEVSQLNRTMSNIR